MKIPRNVIAYVDAVPKIIQVLEDFESAVVSTLGPMGHTTVIGSVDESVPHVTKDGVTVSESIHYLDPLQEAIATLLRESARRTAEEVGDGTTTSMLIACTLIKSAIEERDNGGSDNLRSFFDGVEKAIDYAIEYLQEETVEIEMGSDELKAVIKISSNSDKELTANLVEVTEAVGVHGIIDVKLSESNEVEVNISDGAMLDTNVVLFPGSSNSFEVEGLCEIVLVESGVSTINSITELLTHASRGQAVILIAKEFSKEVINIVRTNNNRSVTNIVLAEAEGFGKSRLEILRDLSAITNADIFSTDGSTEFALRSFNPALAGKVNGCTVNSEEVILYCDPMFTESEESKSRFAVLSEEYVQHNTGSDIVSAGEHNVLKRRMAKYVSLATINVGGVTRAIANEVKDRYDDAVHAISAAVNSGVLPGGGASLVRAINIIEARRDTFSVKEVNGSKVVIEACKAPLNRLCSNSGFVLSNEIFQEILEGEAISYNILTKKIVNAYEEGILDPALVLIKSLINASAVMKSIMNSNAFIIPDYGEVQR